MNPQIDLQSLCRRLEFAQAAQNQAMAEAQGRMNPESGARCQRIGSLERGAFMLLRKIELSKRRPKILGDDFSEQGEVVPDVAEAADLLANRPGFHRATLTRLFRPRIDVSLQIVGAEIRDARGWLQDAEQVGEMCRLSGERILLLGPAWQ